MELVKLKDCFPAADIEWRLQSCGEKNGKFWGKCLAYVTNRAIQNRLDEICGPENWKNEYTKAPDGGVLCGISIKINNEWITKWDGAENTDIEGVKGGLSGSMKRAAVQWGIGRYLYNLEENWAIVSDTGKFSGKTRDNKWFNWDPPALPAWALPKITEEELNKAVLSLEGFLNNGVLDDSPKVKAEAERLIKNPDYTRIQNAITFCKNKEVSA